ncbi:MAG: L,D-transpeptidase, partial [Kluyvera intermedia]
MLLKNENRRRLLAVSLCLAMAFAPLCSALADEPELVPSDSTALPAEASPVLLQPGTQSSAMASLVGSQPLADGAAAKSRAEIQGI